MNPDTDTKKPEVDAPEASSQAEAVVPARAQGISKYTPPTDPSKYIRTYAKDVAEINHTPVPAVTPKSQPVPLEPATSTTEEGVTVTEYDSSPIDHGDNPASPKEHKGEEVVLSKNDSDGIFSGPQPVEERESILARLREKVSAGKQGITLAPSVPVIPPASVNYPPVNSEPIQEIVVPVQEPPKDTVPVTLPGSLEPVPTEVKPTDIPLRTAAPTFEVPSAFAPPPPDPVPVTPQTPPEAPKTPSPIHTYSSDFADHIDQNQSSAISILAAQSDAGQTPKPVRASRRAFMPLALGIMLVVLGTGVVSGAYFYARSLSNATPVVAGVPSLITFDESIELIGTGPELLQSLSDATQGGAVSGNVIVTYIRTEGSAPQPGGTLIRSLAVPAPDILLRNIDPSSTVGFIRAGSESRPFFLLKVNSYERTFAGMLTWERTIREDLGILYPDYSDMPELMASTTASTTPQTPPQTATGFADAVVSNYDVRILRDTFGRTLMLYGYKDKDILIIARDEAAFTALISRLSSGTH